VAVVSKTAKEGSKMPRADWNLTEAHEIAVPPASLLDAFRDTIDPLIAQLKTLAFQNQKLRAARDLLLPKLMNGEIEPHAVVA
jgi:type I restriction enzyme S subunit